MSLFIHHWYINENIGSEKCQLVYSKVAALSRVTALQQNCHTLLDFLHMKPS